MSRFTPKTTAAFLAAVGLLAIFTWFAGIPMQRAYTRWLLEQLPAGASAPDRDSQMGEGYRQGGGCSEELRGKH